MKREEVKGIIPGITDEQLQQLARHPEAVSYCRQIVKTVDLLAHIPLTEQEQNFLKEIPLH